MTFRNSIASAAFGAAVLVAPFGGLVAQTAPAQSPAQSEAAGYSAADLDAFVAAFVEVNALRSVFTERLQQETDADAQQAIVEEGNGAIIAAIDAVEGMDTELYAAILEQAGSDPALNERLNRRLQDQAEG
jgi:hypothetical protein